MTTDSENEVDPSNSVTLADSADPEQGQPNFVESEDGGLRNLQEQDLCTMIVDHDTNAKMMTNVICKASKTSVDCAIKAGMALLEAKRRVSHGEWGNWLKHHLPEIPRSRICRYMALAQRISHMRNLDEIQTLRQAYLLVGIVRGGRSKCQHRQSNTDPLERLLRITMKTRGAVHALLKKRRPEEMPGEIRERLALELEKLIKLYKSVVGTGEPSSIVQPSCDGVC